MLKRWLRKIFKNKKYIKPKCSNCKHLNNSPSRTCEFEHICLALNLDFWESKDI